jgi:hypothetical protein
MESEKYLDVANLQAEEIANLRAQIARLEGRNPTIAEVDKPWPKVETVYLHASKEAMRDLGERIGLSTKQVDKFKFLFNEVSVSLKINEDGTHEVLSHTLV